MPFKGAGVLAILVAAVSFGAQSTEDAREAGAFGGSIDVIAVILSFFGPMEWSQLGKVGPLWTEAIPNGIAEYLRSHGTPVNTKEYKIIYCSEKRSMEDVLKSVMDKPGFRGAIFNKDECTLINHSLRGSQVCSEKGFDGRVRITGVADVERCSPNNHSRRKNHFLVGTTAFHARNIRTGQDIYIGYHSWAEATMLNEKHVVIVDSSDEMCTYELDWDAGLADCVLRVPKNEHQYRRLPSGSLFYPSPDRKLVVFKMSSIYCIMDRRSHERAGIPDSAEWAYPIHWISDTMFRIRCNDGRFVLRCAHNPSVDLVTLNEDDSVIRKVKVNDELDSTDLFYNLDRIGPDLYYSEKYRRVVEVEWIDNHED